MVSIWHGDHRGTKPASYTRFVLPFAYSLEELSPGGITAPAYRTWDPIPNQIWRERYLTVETADVLFRRTKWLLLDPKEEWQSEHELNFSETKTLSVAMAPPFLVLFEWHDNPNEPKEEDLLQTGFLVVDLYFPKTKGTNPNLDDLLRLNELFRYWQRPWEGHETMKGGYVDLLRNWPLDFARTSTIGKGGVPPDDLYFNRWASLLELPLQEENGKAWRLFPAAWNEKARAWVKTEPKGKGTGSESCWIAYADSRTFVWTCAIAGDGAGALNEAFPITANEAAERHGVALRPWEAHRYGHWIKLLNVDPPKDTPIATHESIMAFERKWAKERTFRRWEEWGTYYGFSYHSGAMLGPPMTNPPFWRHFAEVYFDQVLLLLYLRVSLFRFSTRLNQISASARAEGNDLGKGKWREEFQKLRWHFALFTNLYQFPLLSNQQQGLEMYSLARKIMDVQELFEEVQKEIHSSHDFLAVEEAHRTSQTTGRLTVVATIGLAVGLAFGFLGMNILVSGESSVSTLLCQFLVFAATVTGFFAATVHVIRRSHEIAKQLESISKADPGWWQAMRGVVKAVLRK